jgi:hypothetical protein
VVLLIQQLESFTPALSVQGSYGHLYESVIKLNLSKVAKNASDLESKLNYLTELAHEMFDRGHDGLDQSDFESWHERYQSEFASGVDRNAVLHDLSKASVLEYRHSTVRFCHPHVHNFFAARYLAQHISNGETRRKVDELCATLHTRDSANIMMLLCHFSRDQYLIKAILRVADSLFADVPQFDVGTVPELLPLSNESLEIVLQLETERPPQSRTAMLRQADEIGRKLGESHAVSKGAAEMPDGEFAAIQDFVARFNSAQKTIQIAGQILCNYYGSMKAENQRAIARSCYSLGMRSLKALLGTLEENRSVVFETIAEGLRVRSPGISQQDLMTQVGEAIFVIGHCVTLGHFMHVSDSVGLEKLKVTLDRVVKESPTLSVRMIDVAIRLDHFDDFPQKSVSDLAELLHDNHFAFGVLRHLVWRRFRLFYEDRELTQSMCAKLNIKSPSHLFINPNTKTSEAEGRRAKLRRLPRPKK